jgi:hypothetical protein
MLRSQAHGCLGIPAPLAPRHMDAGVSLHHSLPGSSSFLPRGPSATRKLLFSSVPTLMTCHWSLPRLSLSPPTLGASATMRNADSPVGYDHLRGHSVSLSAPPSAMAGLKAGKAEGKSYLVDFKSSAVCSSARRTARLACGRPNLGAARQGKPCVPHTRELRAGNASFRLGARLPI